jgi:hypothetical protein
VNGHTAIIRSLGITGVLLLLALVLLAIVSAIVAFDRWPDSGGASSVERVAVDRPGVRRVETVLVSSRRTPVVRGVVVARSTAGAFATAPGGGGVLLVGDREPTGQPDGGGFGPPPPSVPFAAPGEGGGPARFVGTTSPAPGPPVEQSPGVIRQATCEAREALGEAGASLDPACNPGQRGGTIREVLARGTEDPTELLDGVVDGVIDGAAGELVR